MQLIRWFLGKLILLVDTLFSPKGLKRSPEAQNKVDEQATRYALRALPICRLPFLRQSSQSDEATIR